MSQGVSLARLGLILRADNAREDISKPIINRLKVIAVRKATAVHMARQMGKAPNRLKAIRAKAMVRKAGKTALVLVIF